MQKQIKITIDPMGNPKVEAENFVGAGCETATAGIERMLSGGKSELADKTLKPEYSQSAEAHQEQQW